MSHDVIGSKTCTKDHLITVVVRILIGTAVLIHVDVAPHHAAIAGVPIATEPGVQHVIKLTEELIRVIGFFIP